LWSLHPSSAPQLPSRRALTSVAHCLPAIPPFRLTGAQPTLDSPRHIPASTVLLQSPHPTSTLYSPRRTDVSTHPSLRCPGTTSAFSPTASPRRAQRNKPVPPAAVCRTSTLDGLLPFARAHLPECELPPRSRIRRACPVPHQGESARLPLFFRAPSTPALQPGPQRISQTDAVALCNCFAALVFVRSSPQCRGAAPLP
jgi:hypothetical protein